MQSTKITSEVAEILKELDQDEQKHAQIVRAYLGTVKQYFGGFNKMFEKVRDPRNPKHNKYSYPLGGMLFTGVLMYLSHLKARRQINHQLRGNGPAEAKFKSLFGVEEIPHGDSVNHVYKQLAVAEVQETVCQMVEALIRKKVLYPWRLLNKYYLIAIDGSGMLTFEERHCEYCLTKKLKNGTTLYYHPVLEAKLVTSNGFALSIMTEFIENRDPQATKQDCELKAFYRLADRLKARFPRLAICLLLDSLYTGGPTFDVCEKKKWKYFIRFKDGGLPTVHRKFEELSRLTPENQSHLEFGHKKEIKQSYRWINEIDYVDTEQRKHQLSVLECAETKPESDGEKKTTTFTWLTNFRPTAITVSILANEGGRLRWKIENEGFNSQKNGGYEAEHTYSEDETAGKIFYLLLQIAHIIFQLVQKGSLFRQAFPTGLGSLKNIAALFLEAWRNLRLSRAGFMSLFGGRFQIRFDSS